MKEEQIIQQDATGIAKSLANSIAKLVAEVSKIVQSDHPLSIMANDIINGIKSILDYKLFFDGQQPVFVSTIIAGLILLAIGIKGAKYFSNKLSVKLKESLGAGAAHSLGRLAYYIFILIVSIVAIEISNIPFAIFAIISTTFAVGIGLSSKDIISNLISGLIILIERPIKVGDIIEIYNYPQHIVGEVTHIGFMVIWPSVIY